MTSRFEAIIPLGVAVTQVVNPSGMEGAPGYVVGAAITVFVLGRVWVNIIHPVYQKKNGKDSVSKVISEVMMQLEERDERGKADTERLRTLEEIRDLGKIILEHVETQKTINMLWKRDMEEVSNKLDRLLGKSA